MRIKATSSFLTDIPKGCILKLMIRGENDMQLMQLQNESKLFLVKRIIREN